MRSDTLLNVRSLQRVLLGNTVVAKPSELTSITAYELCKIMYQAGLPPGVVNMVFGRGATVGEAIVEHKYVPLISFTGGTKTGARIAERAAKLVKKLSLEVSHMKVL